MDTLTGKRETLSEEYLVWNLKQKVDWEILKQIGF